MLKLFRHLARLLLQFVLFWFLSFYLNFFLFPLFFLCCVHNDDVFLMSLEDVFNGFFRSKITFKMLRNLKDKQIQQCTNENQSPACTVCSHEILKS